MIIVDDRLLFDVLAGTESPELLDRARGGVATTFSWYYRLARAIATGRIEGSLSRHYGDLSAEQTVSATFPVCWTTSPIALRSSHRKTSFP